MANYFFICVQKSETKWTESTWGLSLAMLNFKKLKQSFKLQIQSDIIKICTLNLISKAWKQELSFVQCEPFFNNKKWAYMFGMLWIDPETVLVLSTIHRIPGLLNIIVGPVLQGRDRSSVSYRVLVLLLVCAVDDLQACSVMSTAMTKASPFLFRFSIYWRTHNNKLLLRQFW